MLSTVLYFYLRTLLFWNLKLLGVRKFVPGGTDFVRTAGCKIVKHRVKQEKEHDCFSSLLVQNCPLLKFFFSP